MEYSMGSRESLLANLRQRRQVASVAKKKSWLGCTFIKHQGQGGKQRKEKEALADGMIVNPR